MSLIIGRPPRGVQSTHQRRGAGGAGAGGQGWIYYWAKKSLSFSNTSHPKSQIPPCIYHIHLSFPQSDIEPRLGGGGVHGWGRYKMGVV